VPCDQRRDVRAANADTAALIHAVDGQNRGLLRLAHERQGVVHGTRGLAAAVPRHQNPAACRAFVARIGHQQDRTSTRQDQVLREEIADIRFGVVGIVLAGHDQIGAAAKTRYGIARGLVGGDPFALDFRAQQLRVKEPLERGSPFCASLFVLTVVLGRAGHHIKRARVRRKHGEHGREMRAELSGERQRGFEPRMRAQAGIEVNDDGLEAHGECSTKRTTQRRMSSSLGTAWSAALMQINGGQGGSPRGDV